ncbi:hypothetical protein Goari_010625, partial [Gossypium aridum]|nr:hypothetical protein [Gossypium aridum]
MLEGSNYAYWKVRMKAFIKPTYEKALCLLLTCWAPPMIETKMRRTLNSKLAWTTEKEKKFE